MRVPNPAAYVAEKLLVLARRKREDQERDILYIHDTLQTFGAHLLEVRESWITNVELHLHRRHLRQLKGCSRGRFEVTGLIGGAAHIATSVGRSVSPQSILEACQFGLERIFW